MLLHDHRAERAGEADDGADRKVDVSSGQDAEQHAGSEDKYIAVLRNQVIDILRIQDLALCADREEDNNQDQRKDHGILLQKIADTAFFHRQSPLPRIVAMMLSWVASAAFISPTILDAFMI